MKEETLHHWWRSKNVDFRTFTYPIQIIDFGEYNRFENGPDFIGAKIQMNNILWCGAVEIHINASDWDKHGHQNDNTFNNVILHVVQNKDKEVYNARNELVPTIELKPFSKNYNKQRIACEKSLYRVDRWTFISELEHSLIDRLNRKASLIDTQQMIYQFDYQAVFKMLLFRSFGNKVNQHFFEQLFVVSYPYLNRSNDDFQVLLFGFAGFELTNRQREIWEYLKHKFDICQTTPIQWRTKGFYASSSPVFRLKQLTETLKLLHDVDVYQMTVENWIAVRSLIIQQHILSKSQVDLMYINAVVLFYWWFEKHSGDFLFKERAIDLLTELPPEKNSIVNRWKDFGITPQNAFDSQALLELTNQKCTFTKCLECKIGKTLL